MELILVRHGECGTSSIDDILTPTGEWQALQVGKRLADLHIAAFLSSPLLRALGTASIVAQQLGNCPFEVWTELREGLDAVYHGYGRQELLQRFPLAILPTDIKHDGWYHRGETQETMFERCQHILDRLHARFEPNDIIVIIAHGGILNYFLHVILNISPQTPVWFEMAYGAISQVRFVPKEQRHAYPPLYPEMTVEIHSINDIMHLRRVE